MVQYLPQNPYGTDTYTRGPSLPGQDNSYQAAQARYIDSLNRNKDAASQNSAARKKAKDEAEQEARRQQALLARDQLQQAHAQQNAAQHAANAADAAAMDHLYSTQSQQQHQRDLLKRDATQQGYSKENVRVQQQNLLNRDASQFGYSTQERQQQHQNTLQRDDIQFGQQTQRDQQQNQYQQQRDESQFGYSTQQDQQRQQYTQQNFAQRETADVSTKWNDQVQQSRQNGFDFSEKQQAKMKSMEESFRKNVLNGDLDEGLKQQAMLQYQKDLSAIIPDEKVRNEQNEFKGRIVVDEETGHKFLVGRDSRGNSTYEQMYSGGGKSQQEMTPQELESKKNKAELDRAEAWQKTKDKMALKQDANGDPRYKSEEDLNKATMDAFGFHEDYFRKEHGLAPSLEYQKEADQQKMAKQKEFEKWQKKPHVDQGPKSPPVPMLNMNDPMGMQKPMPPQQQQVQQPPPVQSIQPPVPSKPAKVSSANIDQEIQKSAASGDSEVSSALAAIKVITGKHGGAPPVGSRDSEEMLSIYSFLKEKGVSIGGEKAKHRKPNQFDDALGGWMQ